MPDAPLNEQLKQASAQMRAALADFGFAPESFENLSDRAAQVATALREHNAPHAAERLDTLNTTFRKCLEAAPTDLAARGRAYLALLDSVLMQSIATEARNQRWLDALDRRFKPEAAPEDANLSLLTVAQMCADIGAKVTPPDADLARLEWQGWRVALSAASASSASDIAPGVARATAALKAARTPGLIVLDLADTICPERRPLRASHPDAGAAELRARLDRVLQTARPAILESTDHDHAVAVIGCAFLAIHLVPVDQVAFITAYRFMSLLDPTDPREQKLTRFRTRFGDL